MESQDFTLSPFLLQDLALVLVLKDSPVHYIQKLNLMEMQRVIEQGVDPCEVE